MKKLLLYGIKAVMLGLVFLSFLKGIWISLDIDESYAVAMGYRMAVGDRLVRDMWEPHQFSGFLAAFFTAPYIWIRGNTEYLVIYLRVISILIHGALGVALYRQLKKTQNCFWAYGITVLHLLFLPKWVQTLEFELMHYWCMLGMFLTLYAYFTGRKPRMALPFAGGCLLACSILCYPTMILLYPFYILALCMLEKQYFKTGGGKLWKSSCFFTLGAFLTGGICLIYLFSYMSPAELKRYISYIFMDTSHGVYTMGEKWAIYLEQILMQAKSYSLCLLSAAGIILAMCLVHLLVSRRTCLCKGGREKIKKTIPAADVLSVVTAILVLAGILLQAEAAYGFIFEDKNQFYLQIRYIAFLLPAVVLGISYYKKMAVWLYLCILPAFVSVAAVLFVTNMDTNVTYSKAFLGVLGSLLVLDRYRREVLGNTFGKRVFSVLQYTAGGMLLVGLLICRLVLIRVSGCLPVTIRAPLEKMDSGPEKGIWVLADTAEIWNDNYQVLEKYIDREDAVLYIGAESLVYVDMEALLATPTTLSTTVYNEVFLNYYEEHPERIPNVIVYDKTYGENPVYALSYAFSLQDPVLFQWVEKNYATGQRIETDHLIIIKKR